MPSNKETKGNQKKQYVQKYLKCQFLMQQEMLQKMIV